MDVGDCNAACGRIIRLGNLMNSKLLPTNVPWAMIFTRFDDIPRHPATLRSSFLFCPFCGIVDSLSQKTVGERWILSQRGNGGHLSFSLFYRICKRGADAVRKSNDSQYGTMAKYSVYCGR